MSEPGERSEQDRSPVIDFVIEGALEGCSGCLFEAALTGCAPVLLLLIGVPALLNWWM